MIEFEKYADIQFCLEEKKKNRKVEELIFRIYKKASRNKIDFENPISKDLRKRFMLTSKQTQKVLSKFV